MGDRNLDDLPLGIACGESTLCFFDAQGAGLAYVFQAGVSQQRTRQQPRFGQNLKSIAGREDIAATVRMGNQCPGNGRPGRDGSAAQIIAIAEPTRNADDINVLWKLRFFVPDHRRIEPGTPKGHGQIAVAVGPWEDEDGGFHGAAFTFWGNSGRDISHFVQEF